MFDPPYEQRPKGESEIEQLRVRSPELHRRLVVLAEELFKECGATLRVSVPDDDVPLSAHLQPHDPRVQYGDSSRSMTVPPVSPPAAPSRPDSLAIATAEPDADEARHEKIASHIRRAITAGGAVLATLGLTKPQWFSWLFEHANTIATLVGFALPFVTAWWSTRNINRTKTHEAQRVTAAQYVPAPVAGQAPLSVAEVKTVAQAAVTRATGQLQQQGEQA